VDDPDIREVVVLAYGRGMGVALAGSLLLVAQQSFLLLQSGRSAVSAVGSVVFVLYAVIFWLALWNDPHVGQGAESCRGRVDG
jgi:hypothetical protein